MHYCYLFDVPLNLQHARLRHEHMCAIAHYIFNIFAFFAPGQLSPFNKSRVVVMVHDPQEEIHDAKHGQFVMDLELGKSRKMRFSKTVVESLSRPTKQCANEPLGQETCIAQKVSKF